MFGLEDLANVFDIDEDNVNELKDDWQVRVELSDLEPIFNVDADSLCQLLADANDNRIAEYRQINLAFLISLELKLMKSILPNTKKNGMITNQF